MPKQNLFKRVGLAILFLAAVVWAAWSVQGVDAQEVVPDASQYTWSLVSDGFDNPLYVTTDGSNRLFVAEQTGMVWIVEDGEQSFDPFLDVSSQLPAAVFRGGYSEQGLLGLAFHPDYAANGRLFVSYTDINGDSILSEMRVDAANPNQVDPASERMILKLDQPFDNHNGGQITFGPEGYLYYALGDGGDQGDPFGNAQNPASLLGKILRLDVDSAEPYAIPEDNPFVGSTEYAPEIWQMGFRNPWRFSFDRSTNDLYVADVGEWLMEEVNFLPADESGRNFGWEFLEGTLERDSQAPQGLTAPILTYEHTLGCSITGGYVYRGSEMPELQGYYFYGDYCVGNLWIAWRDADGTWQSTLWMNTGRQISSFGEDAAGELYLVDYKGEVLRLMRQP